MQQEAKEKKDKRSEDGLEVLVTELGKQKECCGKPGKNTTNNN